MSEETLPGGASSPDAEASEGVSVAEGDDDEGREAEASEPPYPRSARYVAPALAWLFPGAGHLYLARRGKALVFFLVVAAMLAAGLLLDGKLYSPREGDMFAWFGSYACLGLGPVYFVLRALALGAGDAFSPWAEYGNRFVLTAGVMNLILMLDAFDLAVGRKEKSL